MSPGGANREARTAQDQRQRAGVVKVEVEGAHGRAGSWEERDTCLNPWNISPKWTKAQEGSRTLQGHLSGQRLGADCPPHPHGLKRPAFGEMVPTPT